MNIFAQRFKESMKQRKMSQEKLAFFLNVKQSAISKWANGKREPDLDTLMKICCILDEDIAYMLGYDFKKVEQSIVAYKVLHDIDYQTKSTMVTDWGGKTAEEWQDEYYTKYYNAYLKELRK